ncbi:MBL fold metallo-hydrolase [Rubritalea marina]|uniref:MBL fold metallo-hydrolase n=1 Tax=Rubritalea marina TaxID=361055 RepID=UPI00035EFBE2|nr:MBL fold metallo-hydrolase [Rubritalea marina]
MQFQNLARKNEIGANCYHLETSDCSIVLDSGMHPKHEGPDALPAHHELPPHSVDAIVLSHAHLDHTGTIPVIMRDQEDAPLYLTEATSHLAKALLHNSVNVMQHKRLELGITEYPLYGHRELDRLAKRWEPKPYEKPWKINRDTQLSFYDAGHILGSAGVMIESEGKRVFYTGDIQFEDQTLITGARFPEENIDALIIETTRGAAPRAPGYDRQSEEDKLLQAILDTIERGGSALIPVFAMGKTQEVLTMIHKFKSDGRLPEKTPVYMGGLSTKMTHIFDDLSDSTSRKLPDFKILEDMDINTGSKKHKGAPITYRPGAIFCLSSGMMSENTTSNIFAQTFVSNPKNSLLFVGYCDPDSPGGAIRETRHGDIIRLSKDKDPVVLNCPVEIFDFSGHATRDAILDYILRVQAKQVFLVHGDLPASEWFQQQLAERLPNCDCIIPLPSKKYSI